MEEISLMRGKVILITGASRGIGAATARLFGKHGSSVAVNYHNSEQEAKQLVRDIETMGGKAIAVQADVEDTAQVISMIQQVEERLGLIDTLVLNAAPTHTLEDVPFSHYSWDAFQKTVLSELAAVFIPTQAAVASMIERKQGNIIVVGSQMARRPIERIAAHATAKASLEGLVKVLATELGQYNIRVNLVAPGLTNTHIAALYPEPMKQMVAAMTPLRRIAEPEDIAGAIFLLALPEARYLTGNYIAASGGNILP